MGIIVQQSLQSTSQCIEAAKSANKTLGMISRTFMYKDKITILRQYKSLVWPKLEYCIERLQIGVVSSNEVDRGVVAGLR